MDTRQAASMEKTKLLQEVRKMRFEAYDDCLNKRVTREEAARLGGCVTDRFFGMFISMKKAAWRN